MLQIQDTITELVTFPFPRRLVYFEALNTTLQLLCAMLKARRKKWFDYTYKQEILQNVKAVLQ